MNTGQVTGAILLDLKKAFDVIPHKKILEKLPYYGVRIKELKWFENYLIGRKCVSISQCSSDFVTLKSGMPQGSILGPLLFCLYINDMCNLNMGKKTRKKKSLYANDIAVFNNNVSLLKVHEYLQKDVDVISQWLENNDMHLHPNKTKVMIFGPET